MANNQELQGQSQFVAVVISLIAVTITAVGVSQSRQTTVSQPRQTAVSRVARIERQFHVAMRDWTPSMGVRAPNPKVLDQTNLSLLRLYKIEDAPLSAVSQAVGPPNAIFQNQMYPEIHYCKHPDHWTVMCPNCVTILPRNRQYDTIMELSLEHWACTRVSRIVTANSAAPAR